MERSHLALCIAKRCHISNFTQPLSRCRVLFCLLCKGELPEDRRCGEVGEEGLHGDRAVLEEAGSAQPQRPRPLVHERRADASVEADC